MYKIDSIRRWQRNAFTLVELPVVSKCKRYAFTLVELLVVVSIIALLVSIMLPSLTAAKERARVVKVHAELRGIGLALEMYARDFNRSYPPVRVSCNQDMVGHEWQLPVELSNEGYLPPGPDLRQMVGVEDIFNPDHTYKYNAPGDQVLNNSLIKNGNYIWVPDAFPGDDGEGDINATDDGKWYNDPAESPVRWILWSQGPAPGSEKSSTKRRPISRRTWYRRSGDTGVICRIRDRNGQILTSP